MRGKRGVSACFVLFFLINSLVRAEQEVLSTDLPTSPIFGPLRITAERYVKQKSADIRSGSEINFIVKLSWQGKLDAVRVERPRIGELEGLRYLYVTPSTGIEPEAGRAWAEFNYTLEPQQKGKARIGALEINYTIPATGEKGRLETEPLEVKVLATPIKWGKVFIYAGVAIVGVIIVSGAILLFLNLKQRRPVAEEEPVSSPYERIKGELSSIKMYLIEGESKTFYDKLVKLAKQIVRLETGEEIGHLTTEEMGKYLENKGFNEDFRRRIVSVLERSDNVRYAGHLPSPQENEMVLKELQEIIDQKIRPSLMQKGKL